MLVLTVLSATRTRCFTNSKHLGQVSWNRTALDQNQLEPPASALVRAGSDFFKDPLVNRKNDSALKEPAKLSSLEPQSRLVERSAASVLSAKNTGSSPEYFHETENRGDTVIHKHMYFHAPDPSEIFSDAHSQEEADIKRFGVNPRAGSNYDYLLPGYSSLLGPGDNSAEQVYDGGATGKQQEKHYKIIFIKAPLPPTPKTTTTPPPPSPVPTKTLVYVMLPQERKGTPATTTTTTPRTEDPPLVRQSIMISRKCLVFRRLPPDHPLLDSAPNLGPLISRWEINKFENCLYKSVRILKVLKLLFQHFLNLSSSQRDMSGSILGDLSNNM
jgi:hypothetical protein